MPRPKTSPTKGDVDAARKARLAKAEANKAKHGAKVSRERADAEAEHIFGQPEGQTPPTKPKRKTK